MTDPTAPPPGGEDPTANSFDASSPYSSATPPDSSGSPAGGTGTPPEGTAAASLYAPADPVGPNPYASGGPAVPAGYETPAAPYGAPMYGGYPYPQAAPPTNGMAIASMIVSIVALVSVPCYGLGGLLLGPVGAILGHVSRRQIRQRAEQGGGMALAGVIMGWIATGLGLAVLALVIVAVVISMNETS